MLLTALLAGCLDAPGTGTTEQKVCTEDNPGCDTAWFRAHAIGSTYNAASYNGVTITETPLAYCDATHCHVDAPLGGGDYLTTDCFDFGAVEWCQHQVCDQVDDDSWQCHDVPPID